MNMEDFIEYCREGNYIRGDDKEKAPLMHEASQNAIRITAILNNSYHSPNEVIKLFEELTGKEIDKSFRCFPPFYTDFGKNITIGKNVFFNINCSFQDRGGIIIGDGVFIGQNVIISTLNHGINLKDRNTTYPSKVVIGNNVWIGSGANILPGISIGDNSIIGAGSVVSKDIPSNSIAVGVPAKVIKSIKDIENIKNKNDLELAF